MLKSVCLLYLAMVQKNLQRQKENSFVQNVQHHYGARLNNQPGKDSFVVYCGKVDEGDRYNLDDKRTRAPVGYNGTLVKVGYLSESATTSTQMQIYVNKVGQGTFSLSNINLETVILFHLKKCQNNSFSYNKWRE